MADNFEESKLTDYERCELAEGLGSALQEIDALECYGEEDYSALRKLHDKLTSLKEFDFIIRKI